MVSGHLKYTLKFFEKQKTQTPSGAIKEAEVELFKQKAALIKDDEKFEINAKENFYSVKLKFKMRYNKAINEDLLVQFENKKYRIKSLIENKFDNSLTIEIEKINI